jgi:hypothetical protein
MTGDIWHSGQPLNSRGHITSAALPAGIDHDAPHARSAGFSPCATNRPRVVADSTHFLDLRVHFCRPTVRNVWPERPSYRGDPN